MTKRNKILLLIGVILLLVNLGFLFIHPERSELSFDEELFSLSDTASVKKIIIGDIILAQTPDGWLINDEYHMDESLRRLLISILQRTTVKRPSNVSAPDNALIVEVISKSPYAFEVWGNPTKTKTFASLKGSDETYEVHIPGYNEYLGSVFELTRDQWRDRLLVDGSWRTIQDLRLSYAGDKLNISFEDDFFKVKGIQELDSNRVVEYLNQFQHFQGNEWISSGRFPRYDSLAKKPPLATLSIETINATDPVILEIYPKIPGERFHLVTTYRGAMIVIDEKRINNILRKPAYFRYRTDS